MEEEIDLSEEEEEEEGRKWRNRWELRESFSGEGMSGGSTRCFLIK